MGESNPRHHLFDRARQRAGWSVQQLWLATIAAGGTTSVLDLEAFLYGLTALPPAQQDVLASALNERLADLYREAQVPYLTGAGPAQPPVEEPLAVLDALLHAHSGQGLRPADDAPG